MEYERDLKAMVAKKKAAKEALQKGVEVPKTDASGRKIGS